MSGETLRATVVITTKNRRDDLAVALRSCTAQVPLPEIIVIDDGSTDGTSALVEREFPGVTLVRHEASRGLVVRRNEGARLATGDVVVSIDDDAAFTSPDVVAASLGPFRHPRVGAVAIPYIDVKKDDVVRQCAPGGDDVWVAPRFIGTAHAVRRDVFLALGGYRDALVHQGEESDYCIRMLHAGWLVALGRGAPIHHFESPRRDTTRMDYYGARNAVLFVLQNVPWPHVVWHLPLTAVRVAAWTLNPARLRIRLRAMADALGLARTAERAPVSVATWRIHRELARQGAMALAVLERRWPSQMGDHAPHLPPPSARSRLQVGEG